MTIKLFEVGGSIRDELLGISNPPDRDFCAESPGGWEPLLKWCESSMSRVFLVTPEFFTIRGIMPNGMAVDVVMCRKDGPSSDGRHPNSVEPGTLEDDLRRRDFTVNAMAREVNPSTLEPVGKIIDPFNGQVDLCKHLLRCVGNTEDRLDEDGLRILRAARFCVTKNLGPTKELQKALNDAAMWAFMVNTVSTERVREELQKMLKHNGVGAMRFLVRHCANSTLEVLLGSGSEIWLKPTLEKK